MKKSPLFVLALVQVFLLLICCPLVGQDSPQQGVVPISSLTSRKEALEQQLDAKRKAGASEDDADTVNLEKQLLEATGQEDAALQEIPTASKAAGIQAWLSIPVYFATDRARNSTNGFSGDMRSSGFEIGSAKVTLSVSYGVRTDLISGAATLPLTTTDTVPTIAPIASGSILNAIKATDAASVGKKKRIVLFVHGYNVSFAEAATSAARLSTEVQFPVIPVIYDWPSNGTLTGYWHDEDQIRASFPRFVQFLKDFVLNSPYEVIIVCHSMGSREVTSALSELGRQKVNLPQLKKVVFAAADISAVEFMNAWPDMQKLSGVQYTFYASSHDLPLRLSHIVHQVPRLGDASPIVAVPAGGTTVDASAIDSIYQALGHSYIVNSPRVGADIGNWVDTNNPPQSRGLAQVTIAGKSYFLFR